MIKRTFASRIGLAAIAAMCVVAVTAPAATAEPVASDLACNFNGLTGNLGPAIPYPPAGVEQDGVFTFSGTATCVAVDDTNTGGLVPFTINIKANGNYSNLVVGTGDVLGDGCVSASPDPTGEIGSTTCPALPVNPAGQAALTNYMVLNACGTTGNSRLAFGIDFVAGVGQLGGGACGPTIEPGQVAPDDYNLLGAVSILPNQTPPTPVSTFTVNGAFVAETA